MQTELLHLPLTRPLLWGQNAAFPKALYCICCRRGKIRKQNVTSGNRDGISQVGAGPWYGDGTGLHFCRRIFQQLGYHFPFSSKKWTYPAAQQPKSNKVSIAEIKCNCKKWKMLMPISTQTFLSSQFWWKMTYSYIFEGFQQLSTLLFHSFIFLPKVINKEKSETKFIFSLSRTSD